MKYAQECKIGNHGYVGNQHEDFAIIDVLDFRLGWYLVVHWVSWVPQEPAEDQDWAVSVAEAAVVVVAVGSQLANHTLCRTSIYTKALCGKYRQFQGSSLTSNQTTVFKA